MHFTSNFGMWFVFSPSSFSFVNNMFTWFNQVDGISTRKKLIIGIICRLIGMNKRGRKRTCCAKIDAIIQAEWMIYTSHVAVYTPWVYRILSFILLIKINIYSFDVNTFNDILFGLQTFSIWLYFIHNLDARSHTNAHIYIFIYIRMCFCNL